VTNGTVEIITGRERRRRWSIADKLRIVAESHEPGARVTDVAARHELYPGLLFSWRRQVREGALTAPPPAAFVPVRIVAAEADGSADPPRAIAAPGTPAAPSLVEITLANGCQLRIDQHVDPRALRRIVVALRR
jgi:transposase